MYIHTCFGGSRTAPESSVTRRAKDLQHLQKRLRQLILFWEVYPHHLLPPFARVCFHSKRAVVVFRTRPQTFLGCTRNTAVGCRLMIVESDRHPEKRWILRTHQQRSRGLGVEEQITIRHWYPNPPCRLVCWHYDETRMMCNAKK